MRKKTLQYFCFTVLFCGVALFINACSKSDDSGSSSGSNIPPPSEAKLTLNGSIGAFGELQTGSVSVAKTLTVKGTDLTADVAISITGNFELSLDGTTFSNAVTIPKAEAEGSFRTVHVRFIPPSGETGYMSGNIKFESTGAETLNEAINGVSSAFRHNYVTFSDQRLAFGGGFQQSATQTFNMHNDLSNIERIKMYVKLRCPSGGCNAWDVFAHIQVKDVASGEWYELGRYITPYGVSNVHLDRGFEIDVTDFKSILTGTVELRAFIEVWGADGWLVSVDFDYVEGTPDYPYYAISRLVQYNDNSLGGVIYGEDAAAFDLTKTINVPSNAITTHLRTIVTGWGHATPNDPGGRGCAEWCFRTHDVKINGASTFSHELGALGCGSNPVSPQSGNWQPDRAGWCPGMSVPVRIDDFNTTYAGSSFNFEYDFQDWTNDLASTASNPHAYYAISSFVVVKSNTPINKPTITE